MASERITKRSTVRNGHNPQARVPNLTLRQFREEERGESRREFADAMTRKAHELGKPVEPDENYVARLENGHIKYPGPAYRSVLVALCGKPLADLGFTKFLPPTWAVPDIRDTHEETVAQGINESLRSAIAARGMEIESFAHSVGVHHKTVQRWLAGRMPHPRHRWKVCDILGRSERELWPARPTGDKDSDEQPRDSATVVATRIYQQLGLDEERRAASQLARLGSNVVRGNAARRANVDRRHMADALGDYYGDLGDSYGRYSARYGQGNEIVTSILTSPDWLDLECPLYATHDRLKLTGATTEPVTPLDEAAADAAARRLAETQVTGTVLVNRPLYRLLDISIKRGEISGSVAVTHFVQYALTMDLLEGELIEALADGVSSHLGPLPLRNRYLPDVASVLGVADRLCAGGPVALCAIARPADRYRGPADYLLLIQERSENVLNAARRLTVLPKGFHQPMTDYRADARIGATLRREMEEELFGREDIDNTLTEKYAAEPMHPTRLSEPTRWLMCNPDEMRMECTAFGLNLVNGNCEFACLIVIDDENFWSRYGGMLVANWESSSLRQYSSLDSEALAELIQDPAWSNEGLFALLQGLRRLKQIGRERVNIPAIAWAVRSSES